MLLTHNTYLHRKGNRYDILTVFEPLNTIRNKFRSGHCSLQLILSFFRCVDVPAAPGVPDVTGVSHSSVTLSWRPPHSDGGSPIKGYFVESKSQSAYNWSLCNPGKTFSIMIFSLTINV